jgi:hypothetical protein
MMQQLYALASDLFSLRPWQSLDDSQLTVVRDPASGELYYCSIMGALGQVYAMQAYVGEEGLRSFRKMQTGEFAEPAEFFTITRCVYVEFVPRKELEPQDRELLAALGHPKGRGHASPIFRAMRPGFHPWFVAADEARMLAECIRAVIAVCAAAGQGTEKLWDRAGTYPLVTRVEEEPPRYRIDFVEPVLPPEPPVAPACPDEESLRPLRNRDHAFRGVMELDYIFSGPSVGKKNERKSCTSIALAADAGSGMLYAPEVTDSSVTCGDALARVFLHAIQASRTLPVEVRVRSQKLKDSLDPLMKSLGVKLRVASRLPAVEKARAHLLGFLRGTP